MLHLCDVPNLLEANLRAGLLRAEGIDAEVRGDTLFATLGSGNHVPGTMPSVWILHPADADRARALLAGMAARTPGAAWTCPACGEGHEPPFETCWKCGAERPD